MIVIVDYGVIGNIFSLQKALKLFTDKVVVSSDICDITRADALVLPGVGAFQAGMEGLRERGLEKKLAAAIKSGVPTLGICLGAQLLMERSEEMGQWHGLGAIKGSVVSLPVQKKYKVPHIGWSAVHETHEGVWDGTILSRVKSKDEMYFVHSYVIESKDNELAICKYGEVTFAAALKHDNIYALQFHPEKSGSAGLSVIESFVKLIE